MHTRDLLVATQILVENRYINKGDVFGGKFFYAIFGHISGRFYADLLLRGVAIQFCERVRRYELPNPSSGISSHFTRLQKVPCSEN